MAQQLHTGGISASPLASSPGKVYIQESLRGEIPASLFLEYPSFSGKAASRDAQLPDERDELLVSSKNQRLRRSRRSSVGSIGLGILTVAATALLFLVMQCKREMLHTTRFAGKGLHDGLPSRRLSTQRSLNSLLACNVSFQEVLLARTLQNMAEIASYEEPWGPTALGALRSVNENVSNAERAWIEVEAAGIRSRAAATQANLELAANEARILHNAALMVAEYVTAHPPLSTPFWEGFDSVIRHLSSEVFVWNHCPSSNASNTMSDMQLCLRALTSIRLPGDRHERHFPSFPAVSPPVLSRISLFDIAVQLGALDRAVSLRRSIDRRFCMLLEKAESDAKKALSCDGPAPTEAEVEFLNHALSTSIAQVQAKAVSVAITLAETFDRSDLATDILVAYLSMGAKQASAGRLKWPSTPDPTVREIAGKLRKTVRDRAARWFHDELIASGSLRAFSLTLASDEFYMAMKSIYNPRTELGNYVFTKVSSIVAKNRYLLRNLAEFQYTCTPGDGNDTDQWVLRLINQSEGPGDEDAQKNKSEIPESGDPKPAQGSIANPEAERSPALASLAERLFFQSTAGVYQEALPRPVLGGSLVVEKQGLHDEPSPEVPYSQLSVSFPSTSYHSELLPSTVYWSEGSEVSGFRGIGAAAPRQAGTSSEAGKAGRKSNDVNILPQSRVAQNMKLQSSSEELAVPHQYEEAFWQETQKAAKSLDAERQESLDSQSVDVPLPPNFGSTQSQPRLSTLGSKSFDGGLHQSGGMTMPEYSRHGTAVPRRPRKADHPSKFLSETEWDFIHLGAPLWYIAESEFGIGLDGQSDDRRLQEEEAPTPENVFPDYLYIASPARSDNLLPQVSSATSEASSSVVAHDI